jgi:hypothetical protein
VGHAVAMVRAVSTVAAFQELAEISPDKREQAWVERYEAAYPSLFASYYSSWGDTHARAAAAARAPALAPLLAERETRARWLVEQTAGVLRAEGLLDNEDLAAVFLVGVGSSDGWVASWLEAPALFLALERLPEPPFDEVLVAHELIHLAHERRRPVPWPATVGTRLFAEGLASALSRRLVPGLALDAYLWVDDAHRDWLSECQRRSGQLCAGLLRDLELEEEHGQRYFSASPQLAEGLPVRGGYWAGMLAVQRLLDEPSEASPRPLLDWDFRTATNELTRALTDIDQTIAGSAPSS